MLIKIIVRGAVSIVRASQREANKITKAARRAGYSVATFADWQSGEALTACAEGYDTAAHTEAGAYIPEDERNAAKREREEREEVTLQQIEAAFAKLLA